MKRSLSILDSIRVAEPCPLPWERMAGDGKARFCTQCQKHVHDLSAMVRAEAEAFCQQNPTACIRFARTPAGEFLSADSRKPSRLRKCFWTIPAWLGITVGAGCDSSPHQILGKPVTTAVGRSDDASIRSAIEAARNLNQHLGRQLGEVTTSFGLDVVDLFPIARSAFGGGTESNHFGIHFVSSAGDFIEIYIPRPQKGQWEEAPGLARSEKVLGVAVKSNEDQTWKWAGSVDSTRYSN